MTGRELNNLRIERTTNEVIQKDLRFINVLTGYKNSLIDMSPSSIYTYVNYALIFLRYCNKVDVSTINYDDYTSFLSEQRNKTSSFQKLAHAYLKKFATYLLASGRTQINPMLHIGRTKAPDSQETMTKREQGYLTKAEINKYLKAVRKSYDPELSTESDVWKFRDETIIMVFLNTGMRETALHNLDIDDLNFATKEITVTDKEGKVIRHIMNEALESQLRKWLSVRDNLNIPKDEKALFVSCKCSRLEHTGIKTAVNRFSDCIPGKNIRPHKLRATYGTQIYEATKDIYLTQQCMGHASPQTTEKYIRGQNQAVRQKGADIMNKLTETH